MERIFQLDAGDDLPNSAFAGALHTTYMGDLFVWIPRI
jgi:hypothetical protein